MTKQNGLRKGCKDVFNAFLVENAGYAGLCEFPIIEATKWIPNKLIAFSKAISNTNHDQWIHFYEDDMHFERLWRNPRRYLPLFMRFNGVILPDFSVYRDMPLVMQLWNIYRSRAIGCWLQRNHVKVIPNVRYGDDRTYRICCDGLAKGGTIAVGAHGALKVKEDRKRFIEGLNVVVRRLRPRTIVVYGSCPDSVFGKYREDGITIVSFESEFAMAHKRDD